MLGGYQPLYRPGNPTSSLKSPCLQIEHMMVMAMMVTMMMMMMMFGDVPAAVQAREPHQQLEVALSVDRTDGDDGNDGDIEGTG